jgi:raffinose/stachyose/melibiose transport system permease protein
MAAFGLSRYTFRGREAIYAFFTVGLLFPLSVASLPLYLWLRDLGLLENRFGVILPEAAFSLSITIVILRPFMREIPAELEDAALVDGSTRLGFFWRILIPLSLPALSTVGILAFVTSWNFFLLPLLVFNDQQHFTLPLGVAAFQTQWGRQGLTLTSVSVHADDYTGEVVAVVGVAGGGGGGGADGAGGRLGRGFEGDGVGRAGVGGQ